ncbi:hypothetical protein CapIbe_022823 [Capra ibex]
MTDGPNPACLLLLDSRKIVLTMPWVHHGQHKDKTDTLIGQSKVTCPTPVAWRRIMAAAFAKQWRAGWFAQERMVLGERSDRYP